ncbi:3-phosphoshikimate 1-carboxyvinyltransferase [Pelagibacteraceae bacterium]|nr:3-phosphoshikimate 1-carboxyvinyltransferase [Pelagibacteraceae bacterium]
MISNVITRGINGIPKIPGDKSISHRSIIIPSISNGICEINNILKSDDVLHTLNALKSMGVNIEENKEKIIIQGKGLNSLKKADGEIYLGNSGTSARLLTGLLSSQKFKSILTGDKSLSSRPMQRIADPLSKMNAKVYTTKGSLPLTIEGSNLKAVNFDLKIPSAQIKSGLLLAALNTKGETNITENKVTRDHTEIMLKSFGANIEMKKIGNKKIIKIIGQKELVAKNIDVPNDLSSSSFFIVSTLINKNSKIILKNINNNPSRNGIILALIKMGAKIKLINNRRNNNENICDIEVISSDLRGCELGPEFADLMIDEYPILSIAASFANSPSVFRGLKELRVKESDRLKLILLNLQNCGVNCKSENDDLFIFPSKDYQIKNNLIQTDFDHRIAMAFCIMGTKLGPLHIKDSDSINTSFPSFTNEFNNLGGNIS